MSYIDKLEKIVSLDKKLKKLISLVDELHYFVKHLNKHILCDPFSVDYCPGEDTFIERLYYWVRVYHAVADREPEKIPGMYDVKARIDYKNLRLLEICNDKAPLDCIQVNEKLPLTEDSKKKILEKIKTKIKDMVESHRGLALADKILAIREILYGVEREVDDLRRRYQELRRKLEVIAGGRA